jgi:hypothetical protein
VLPDLREEVEFELGRLSLSLADSAQDRAAILTFPESSRPRTWDMRAAATVLHECHNGVENVLKRCAKHIDRSLPDGQSWHKDLLDQMAQPTERRPAFVSAALRGALEDTLGFRHVARTKYGFDLEWPQLRKLLVTLPNVIAQFDRECRIFFEDLGSRAGE